MNFSNSESDCHECDFCGRRVQQSEIAKHTSSQECSGRCEFTCSMQSEEGEALRHHYVSCLAHHFAEAKRLVNAVTSHQTNVNQQSALRGLHTNLRQLDEADLSGLLIKLKMRSDNVSDVLQSRFSDSLRKTAVHVDRLFTQEQESQYKAVFDQIQLCCDQASKHVACDTPLPENEGEVASEETNLRLRVRFPKDIAALEQSVSKLGESLFANDLELAKVERKVRWLDCTSFDGCFVWKVQNVSALIESARSCSDALRASIWSPSFYTSSDGYRLRLRLFLNGTGQSFGRFVSLFAVIVAGDYDALLEWPFARGVSLQLIDQQTSMTCRTNVSEAEELDLWNAEPQHIAAYIRPRTEFIQAFVRPTDLNDGFGVEQFAPLSVLTPPDEADKLEPISPISRKRRPIYVQQDEMYFRAIVDPINIFI